MEFNKVKCNKCDVLILESTYDKTAGVCMPCFMVDNEGFRPTELMRLKERGLNEYLIRWNIFVKKGVPKIKKNRQIINELNHYLPIVNSSITGYLRFGKGSFDGTQNAEFLDKLKKQCEGDLLKFLDETDQFNRELIDATKKHN